MNATSTEIRFDGIVRDISTSSDWSIYRDGVAEFADNPNALPAVREYWGVVREALEILEEHGDSPARPMDLVEHGVGHRPAGGARGGNQYGAFTVRHPSEKQTRFVARLLATRVVVEPGTESVTSRMRLDALTAFRAGTANLRQTSDLITWLLECPERPADEVAVTDPASPKQAALITKLQGERDLTGFASVEDPTSLSKREASALIDALFKLPKVTNALEAPKASELVLRVGAYKVGDKVYRVYPNQTRERLLAKLWNAETREWDYAGMAFRFVKPEHQMTKDEARQFGADTGMCCVCGRTLTDPNSIDAGIGPVCGGRLR